MFRYERVNSTRKFTIVAKIVSLLKKIYKKDAPFRAVFQVKTLAVLFPPYPGEMKTNTTKFKSAAILTLLMEMVQPIPTRALSHGRGLRMRTYLTAVGLWPDPMQEVRDSRTSRHSQYSCSDSSLTNLVLVRLNLLCLLSHSKPECRWTWPEVPQRSNDWACA